jgi:hypothetical protein
MVLNHRSLTGPFWEQDCLPVSTRHQSTYPPPTTADNLLLSGNIKSLSYFTANDGFTGREIWTTEGVLKAVPLPIP